MSSYGAHQFLKTFPHFSAQALAVLYDNLETVKLAPGTHCVRAVVRGQDLLISLQWFSSRTVGAIHDPRIRDCCVCDKGSASVGESYEARWPA